MSEDLRETFWTGLAKSPYLMVRLDAAHDHAIPMTAILDKEIGPEKGGAFWFFTSKGSRLEAGGPAMAQFVGKGHDLFACISGTLVPEHDQTVIDRLWSNPIEAWFEGGRHDPDLLVLRYDLTDVELWKADLGVKGYFKLMTGKTIDPGEAGKHSAFTF